MKRRKLRYFSREEAIRAAIKAKLEGKPVNDIVNMLKEMGHPISRSTLFRIFKRHGLVKKYKPRRLNVPDEVQELVVSLRKKGLTYREILDELLRSKGYRLTMAKLRTILERHNLVKHRTKYSETVIREIIKLRRQGYTYREIVDYIRLNYNIRVSWSKLYSLFKKHGLLKWRKKK